MVFRLANQMNSDYDAAWYGTFKVAPDQPDPTPDGELYPPKIYSTYDPNWREFVGLVMEGIVLLEPDVNIPIALN